MAIPNTTPTPNELYNGEMRKMSDTELRVVLVVTRHTLGWIADEKTGMRKKEDWISYYQLKQQTGRGYTALSEAIDNCIKNGWIEARDEQGNILDTKEKRHGKRIFYRLGRIFLDKIEDKQTSSESERVQQTSSESELSESELSESGAYKRKTITKEKLLQNIAVASATAEDIVKIINLFKEVSPFSYKDWFKNTTERKAAAELLARLPLDKLEVLITKFLPKLNVMPYVPKNCKAFKPSELLRNLDMIKAKIEELQQKVEKNKSKVGIII